MSETYNSPRLTIDAWIMCHVSRSPTVESPSPTLSALARLAVLPVHLSYIIRLHSPSRFCICICIFLCVLGCSVDGLIAFRPWWRLFTYNHDSVDSLPWILLPGFIRFGQLQILCCVVLNRDACLRPSEFVFRRWMVWSIFYFFFYARHCCDYARVYCGVWKLLYGLISL